MCMWCTWFEHVHVKEGPRDAGKNRIGISRLAGQVIVKTKVSKQVPHAMVKWSGMPEEGSPG